MSFCLIPLLLERFFLGVSFLGEKADTKDDPAEHEGAWVRVGPGIDPFSESEAYTSLEGLGKEHGKSTE